MSSMITLLFVVFMIAIAVLSPWLGTDTSAARSEGAQPENGWFPATPMHQ